MMRAKVEDGVFGFLVLMSVVCLSFQEAEGQFTENFSDTPFSFFPSWIGDTNHFEVSFSSAIPAGIQPGLKLNGTGDGVSALVRPLSVTDWWEWSFWIKLSFNSSANNYVRIYLLSNSETLAGPGKSYYLEIGGRDDSVRLCRSTGDSTIIIITAKDAFAGNSTNAYFFRITYGPEHAWSLYSGEPGMPPLHPEGKGTGVIGFENGWFAVLCNYTSSNASKIYLDEISSGKFQVDSLSPSVLRIHSIDGNLLDVSFSEMIDTAGLGSPGKFRIKETQDELEVLPSADNQCVQLKAAENLEYGHTYHLVIDSICDLSGNCLLNYEGAFIHHYPLLFDVCVSEIMADPLPSVGLPGVEYLELYNRSAYPVYLDGFRLLLNDAVCFFRDGILAPDQYLIVCNLLDTFQMNPYGNVAGVHTFGLSNEGSTIILEDSHGSFISGTEYRMDSFSSNKNEGGWSLELSDPGHACRIGGNWAFSVSETGGSPGIENSLKPITGIPISIENICITGPCQLELGFSGIMDSAALANPGNYILNGSENKVIEAQIGGKLRKRVVLRLSDSLKEHTVYDLETGASLEDACGVLAERNSKQFGIPSVPYEGDLAINEVLFNPLGNGSDYLEIFNLSGSIFDLRDIRVASVVISPPSPPDTVIKPLNAFCRQLLPGKFLLVTEDTMMVCHQYPRHDKASMIESDLPSFNNGGGEVLLLNCDGLVIDRLQFSEDMHFPLLRSVEGVSLERVNPHRPSELRENWQSASELSGFGTPGIMNSQYTDHRQMEFPVTVSPRVFSPDGDGYEDILSIHYDFGKPGISGSVTVFTENGVRIRDLVRNDLMGVGGVLYWDGKDNEGDRAPFGIYILLVDAIDMDGASYRYKQAFGLTDRRYRD